MKERNLRFRLGLFVLTALVVLGVLIILFGARGPASWFRSTTSYSIEFPEAPGVAPGTPVRLSGVRIGEVTDVQLVGETSKVKVGIAIEKRFAIHRHERPTLSASVIGGDTVIDFIPQKQEANKPPLDRSVVPPGATLPGEVVPSVSSLVSRASEVVPTTQDLMNDIRKSLQNIEKLTPEAEATLREYRELAKEARGVVPEVKKTNAQIQEFVRTAQEMMPDLKAAMKEIRKAAAALNEPLSDAKPAPPQDESEVAFRASKPADDKEAQSALKKLMRQLNDAMPEVRKTNLELQKLLGSLNDSVPDVRKTNKDLQDLIKAATDMMPDVRTVVRDFGAAAQQYNKLGENVDKLVRDNQEKVVRIIDNVGATIDRAMDLLSNENRRNVADTLRSIRNGTEKLPDMSKDLEELMKEIKEASKRLRESMTKADDVLTSLRDVMRPLGERSPSITRNLDETLDKLNKLLGDTRELMRVVGESDGTIRRFLTDPSLYNHLDEAACMISKTIPRLDRILKDFETFADKLARHPETIGVSGVVRPGSGLKDPPATYPGHVVPPPGH
jgi:ABC-type transporter Mla subunit MlaD